MFAFPSVQFEGGGGKPQEATCNGISYIFNIA